MSLFLQPPDTITASGIEYKIDTDFRAWVKFQGILLGGGTNDEKSEKICRFMAEIGLPQTKEALDVMLQFYAGASTENETGIGKNVRSFDFEKDSEYIFSAFLESYSIDLTTEKLHWWRFRALFKSLPEDCQMCKIMMYRTIDIRKVPKEQQEFYREMKRRYSLKSDGVGYRTKEEVIEYHKKRRAEAKSQMSEMRSDKQSDMDRLKHRMQGRMDKV